MPNSSVWPSDHNLQRSFVRRQGRMTSGQQRALEQFWDRFGLDLQDKVYDWDEVFGRSAARILEIGFGNGESLLVMAQHCPEQDFIGIEVHRPGVGHLLIQVMELNLSNIRVFCADAVAVLNSSIAAASLDRIQLFFPDPWPKKRHHKRRLIQPPFVVLLADKLKPGGILHLATDWQDYAEHMLTVLELSPCFSNTATGFAPRPPERPLTKYEQRGQRLGHTVYDLLYRRC